MSDKNKERWDHSTKPNVNINALLSIGIAHNCTKDDVAASIIRKAWQGQYLGKVWFRVRILYPQYIIESFLRSMEHLSGLLYFSKAIRS